MGASNEPQKNIVFMIEPETIDYRRKVRKCSKMKVVICSKNMLIQSGAFWGVGACSFYFKKIHNV